MTVLVALSLGLLFAFPRYGQLGSPHLPAAWQAILEQVAHPFRQLHYPADSHESKLAFRLTVPVLAHPFELGRGGMLVVQGVCAAALILLAVRLANELTGDRVSAALFGAAIALTWTGLCGLLQIRGVSDVVGLLLLVGALSARRWPIVGGLVFAAAFSDERALLAAALVIVFHVIRGNRAAYLGAAGGIVAYLAVRGLLSLTTDLSTAGGEVRPGQSWEAGPFGAWSALEGCWVVIAVGFLELVRTGRRVEALLMAAGLAAVTLAAVSVIDVTRSMAYALPAVFVGLAALGGRSPDFMRRLALLCFALCLLWPVFTGGSNGYSQQPPLLARL